VDVMDADDGTLLLVFLLRMLSKWMLLLLEFEFECSLLLWLMVCPLLVIIFSILLPVEIELFAFELPPPCWTGCWRDYCWCQNFFYCRKVWVHS